MTTTTTRLLVQCLVFCHHCLKVPCNKIRVTQWSPEDFDALSISGQQRSPPHSGVGVDCLSGPLQTVAHNGPGSCTIPQLCLAQQRHQGVSRPIPRVVKAPASRVIPPGLSKVQKLEQALLLIRLSRSCHRRSEARVGEGPACVEEITNRCRTRAVPQVYLKVREEGGRVGCGTFSRNQCSSRSEGSPPAFGGRTSRSHDLPEPSTPIVSFSRCRDCRVEC